MTSFETFKEYCLFQRDVRATQPNFQTMYEALVANGFPLDIVVPKEAWGAAYVATKNQLELRETNTTGIQVQGDSNGPNGRLSHQKLQAIAEADVAKRADANKDRNAKAAEAAFQHDLTNARNFLVCANGRTNWAKSREGQTKRIKEVCEKYGREIPSE